jgi:hypothetical protein
VDDCQLGNSTKLLKELCGSSPCVANIGSKDDETWQIINKPKHPKKLGNTRNKMEGPTSKKTKKKTT